MDRHEETIWSIVAQLKGIEWLKNDGRVTKESIAAEARMYNENITEDVIEAMSKLESVSMKKTVDNDEDPW